MTIYKFFDCDQYDAEVEFDIAGEDYQQLLTLCFQHSASVSFLLSPLFKEDLSELEPYRLPLTDNVKAIYGDDVACMELAAHYQFEPYRPVHYRLAPEVRHFMRTRVNSIFQWLMGWGFENPDNPCFFRSDDSVFFSSIIHEGEITLHPDPDEDVSQIFHIGIWHRMVGRWKWHQKKRWYDDGSWAMYGGPGIQFVPGYPGYGLICLPQIAGPKDEEEKPGSASAP